jgi:FdhE protein
MNETARRWIERHPYLESIASFHDAIEGAATAAGLPRAPVPALDAWAEELLAGVPLLRSEKAGLRGAPALGEAVAKLAAAAATAPIPEKLQAAAAELRDRLADPAERARVVDWLVRGDAGADGEAPENAGLVRFVGWTALAHALAPAVEAAAAWRNDDTWNRGSCPTCGALPMMAQLVPAEVGRRRFLACGQCHTRWKHRRIVCPHCANEDANRLAVLEVQGEPGLRLDVCDACKGYVKTYDGEGQEALLLADWPTLHLDVLAGERGFERRGASLYDLDD